MTAVETLLSVFDVRVEPFAICDVRGGRRLRLEGTSHVTLHYALGGSGVIAVGGNHTFNFAPGAVIIVPRGLTQEIGDNLGRNGALDRGTDDSHCRTLPEGMRWLRAGLGDPDIVMACGRIQATYGAETGVFDLLREPIVEQFPDSHPVHMVFQTLLDELSEPRLGTKALAEGLMKQCLILVLRRLAERQDLRLPWLTALADPRLDAAVQAMLSHPERVQGIDGLAELAGMSRSTFCAHFRQAFGRSPHGFLSENRLRRAARYLETTELPVKAIANRTGYRSRSNFSRAFKALYGIDPNAYRQNSAGRPITPKESVI
ncbi:MAG: helix-turn-helix domain-containing protein [Alphaproteobacteria bacterium]